MSLDYRAQRRIKAARPPVRAFLQIGDCVGSIVQFRVCNDAALFQLLLLSQYCILWKTLCQEPLQLSQSAIAALARVDGGTGISRAPQARRHLPITPR